MTSRDSDQVIIGTLADANGSYGPGAVWMAGEKITGVTHTVPEESELSGLTVTDATGAYVLPGAIDAHVHCYSYNGEGMFAATRAAAAGGVTTIVEMPYDETAPVKNVDRLNEKRQIVADEAVTDVALLGTLWPGGGWREAGPMADAGAVGFKVSLFHTHPDRFPRVDDSELLDTMSAVTDVNRTLCVHAENNEVVQHLSKIEAKSNPYDPLTHIRTRPPVSESLGVLTAMEIARDRGTKLHLCHMSIPRAINLCRWWCEDGADITLETCPHYLTFRVEDMKSQGGLLKINPPLRDGDSVDGLWRGIVDGLVPVISSDHAPWPLSMKEDAKILTNKSGVPGVQTVAIVPLGKAFAIDPDPSGLFHNVVKAVTAGPADRFGFGHRKGRLVPGYDADIMIFRPDTDYEITNEEQKSNAGWTPYAGMHPGGFVETTFLRGRRIWNYADEKLIESTGELVTPE
jgi:allantoinase